MGILIRGNSMRKGTEAGQRLKSKKSFHDLVHRMQEESRKPM